MKSARGFGATVFVLLYVYAGDLREALAIDIDRS